MRLRGVFGTVIGQEHIDQHHADVVGAAVGIGSRHEILSRHLGIGDRGQRQGDLLVIELVGQPIAAQQDPVPLAHRDREGVGGHVGSEAEGPGDDVALLVGLRLLGRELPSSDHLGHHRVVLGDLRQGARPEPVGPRVADVHHHEPVSRLTPEQAGRDQRGAHPRQGGITQARLIDRRVRRIDRLTECRLRPDTLACGLEAADGHRGGDVTGRVPAHAVGDDEEGRRGEDGVLVDRPAAAHIAGRSRAEQGHRATSKIVPPTWTTSPRARRVGTTTRSVFT